VRQPAVALCATESTCLPSSNPTARLVECHKVLSAILATAVEVIWAGGAHGGMAHSQVLGIARHGAGFGGARLSRSSSCGRSPQQRSESNGGGERSAGSGRGAA
jgi:hypothetical protein